MARKSDDDVERPILTGHQVAKTRGLAAVNVRFTPEENDELRRLVGLGRIRPFAVAAVLAAAAAAVEEYERKIREGG